MNKFLIWLRRVLGALIGGVSLLFFVDIAHLLPMQLHGFFHAQIVPALMGGSVVLLIVMFLLTLILGRVYCSVLCPLGILQDFILRIKKWSMKALGRRKSLIAKYKKPLNMIRYSVLGVVVVAFVGGVSLPLMLLDPYSTFGRIATSIVRPVVVWANNLLASAMNAAGNYSVYNISEMGAPWFVSLFAGAVLVILVILVWRRGRLWCNTMCPVGTALGLISRFSLFRVSLGGECNSCGMCAGACKAHCIDVKQKTVDASRCVACFDCLDKCSKGGVKYSPSGWKFLCRSKVGSKVDETAAPVADESRRQFLKGTAMAVAAIPAGAVFGGVLNEGGGDAGAEAGEKYPRLRKRTKLPMPPGAISRQRFERKCTACMLCVDKCPTNVLQPALLENGLSGMMQPYMKFQVERFCNYECKVCMDVCPNHAIFPMSIEEKKLTRVGYANFKRKHCVVFVDNQDCGACAEHCPSQAVHMVEYKDGLTIPQVEVELCIGCGGCESICPISPPAIFVQGIDEQNQADVPTKDELEIDEITDFGF